MTTVFALEEEGMYGNLNRDARAQRLSGFYCLPTGISSISCRKAEPQMKFVFTFQSNFAPAEAMAFSIKGTASGHALDATVRSC